MAELITLQTGGIRAAVARRPVTRHEYRTYLQALSLPLPSVMARPGLPTAPITYISQRQADAYCRWLADQERAPFRLPAMPEMLEMARAAAERGISLEIWPHTREDLPDVQGLLEEAYFCEWTRETESVPQYGQANAEPRVLGSVFYPPWLRHGNNMVHAQAYMLSTQGYSFVSFRVAQDL